MQVIKRDGRVEKFNVDKIQEALFKALGSRMSAFDMSRQIAKTLKTNAGPMSTDETFNIEEIQDMCEQALMKEAPEAAKAFVLYRHKQAERRRLAALRPDPNAIADYIHPAKYARWIPGLKRRETFEETVDRNMNMHWDMVCDKKTRDLIETAYQYVQEKHVLPSMRSMQFAGPAIEAVNERMFNCSFTHVNRCDVFGHILYLLLCGCGVGYSVQLHHVAKLPKILSMDKVLHYTVEDTIEGWGDALNILIKGAMSGAYVEFNYHKIRPAGQELKTSGGKAPGHIPLRKCIEKVRDILQNAAGRHLTTLECHDIICHSAEAVLAGGIRRSSLIALFSPEDQAMMYCKRFDNFDFVSKNSHRAMANNSVVFLRSKVTKDQFIDLMELNRKSWGDPGFYFTDDIEFGTNPCAEIGLEPTVEGESGFGFCNLTEINVAAIKTEDEFLAACGAAATIGTLQACYTNFSFDKASKKIADRDALLGVSLTGIMDNRDLLTEELLALGVERIKRVNKQVSGMLGINPAKRLTCIKPSGTASLELGGVGSGIHPHHARKYFRRVTANPMEPIARHFRKVNPHMVEEKPNGDLCITFPMLCPEDGRVLEHYSATEFLDEVIFFYNNWVQPGNNGTSGITPSHNVSATVVVKEDEWDDVLEKVWNNRDSFAALSFLPAMSDKNIPYIPREEVTTEQDLEEWRYLIDHYRPVDYTEMTEESDGTAQSQEAACAGGACDILHSHVEKTDGTEYILEGLISYGKYRVIDFVRGKPLQLVEVTRL